MDIAAEVLIPALFTLIGSIIGALVVLKTHKGDPELKYSQIWQSMINEMQEDRAELKQELSQAKKEREALVTEKDTLENERKEITRQLNDAKERITRLEEESEAHEIERQEWQRQKRGYEEAVNGLTDRIADQDKKIAELERRLRTVKRDTDELKKGDTGPLPPTPRK